MSRPVSGPAARKRVVILGGGMAAVTVALQLTEDANWRDNFECITIYQLGWRLGGKGATGRADHTNRIIEHGLHIWLGYYENAFQLIKGIYSSAGRPPDSPMPTWQSAFVGQDYVNVDEYRDGRWNPWMFYVHPNGRTPGDGNVPPLGESMEELIRWINVEWGFVERHVPAVQARPVLRERLARLAPLVAQQEHAIDLLLTLTQIFTLAGQHFSSSGATELDMRRRSLLIEMGSTIMVGLLTENIHTYQDLERLEGVDFAQWLHKYNPRPGFSNLAINPLLRGLYDFAFAFENGDVGRPNFAAAPALRTIFRMCLSYKGSIFYKMKAGMGDTIFAPAYEALRNRGVDIQFFHKVKKLELAADKSRVARIHLGQQATPKGSIYDPLVPVVVDNPPNCLPLPSWPSEPCYDQLVEGEAMRRSKADLESFWTTWPDVKEVTLEADKNFDVVVFGISLGSVPYLCSELVAASGDWANMAEKVTTVRTQSLQLWLTPSIAQLGWNTPSPVLDAWIEPLNTWADMTDIMDFESWGRGRPGSLAYFCGAMMGGIPDQGDAGFPGRARAEVAGSADHLLRGEIGTLWPALKSGGLSPGDVVARHDRANVDPSERYVQSLSDTAKYRLPANGSGFANLVITGDWIQNGYNAGCVEASVWAGIQAANTLLGRPLNEGVMTG